MGSRWCLNCSLFRLLGFCLCDSWWESDEAHLGVRQVCLGFLSCYKFSPYFQILVRIDRLSNSDLFHRSLGNPCCQPAGPPWISIYGPSTVVSTTKLPDEHTPNARQKTDSQRKHQSCTHGPSSKLPRPRLSPPVHNPPISTRSVCHNLQDEHHTSALHRRG